MPPASQQAARISRSTRSMSLSCVIASEIAFKTASSADNVAHCCRALDAAAAWRSSCTMAREARSRSNSGGCTVTAAAGDAGAASTVSSALIISLRSGVRITN